MDDATTPHVTELQGQIEDLEQNLLELLVVQQTILQNLGQEASVNSDYFVYDCLNFEAG